MAIFRTNHRLAIAKSFKNSAVLTTSTEAMGMETNESRTREESSTVRWLSMSPKFRGKKPIDYLYERLHLLYPKRWEAQFDSKEHLEAWKECWGEELDE